MYEFNALKQGYTDLWNKASVTKINTATSQANLIAKYKDVYDDIGKQVGVPWYVIGVLHLREAGPQDVGRWQCVLHNGERIVGTGHQTRLVPAGRGPFSTFKDAAIDAITFEGLAHRSEWQTSPVEFLAYVSEKFNGFGYRNHGIPSPYLWGGTSVQKPGKYVSDGNYDPSVTDTQLGTMAILKCLHPAKANPVVVASTGVTAGAAIISITNPAYIPFIIGGLLIVVVAVGAYLYYRKGKKEDVTVATEDAVKV